MPSMAPRRSDKARETELGFMMIGSPRSPHALMYLHTTKVPPQDLLEQYVGLGAANIDTNTHLHRILSVDIAGP